MQNACLLITTHTHKHLDTDTHTHTHTTQTDQDLAEGLVLQVGEVLGKLAGVQVVEEEGHLPLLGDGGYALRHLPLPLVGRPEGGGVNHID